MLTRHLHLHLCVLNAFRHHRGRHQEPLVRLNGTHFCAQRLSASQRSALIAMRPTAEPVSRSAQRLSASQRSARVNLAIKLGYESGAQRLSASQRSALAPCRRGFGLLGVVLNAFRHHRGRHDRLRRAPAVDAFCAQRLSASQRSARDSVPHALNAVEVLNAFRHHRGRHAAACTIIAGELEMCSTPFGITEVGTGRKRPRARRSRDVLNAFRHHRGRHASRRRAAPMPASGAQRLSASQRSARRSPPLHHRRPLGAQRLSASQRSARRAAGRSNGPSR